MPTTTGSSTFPVVDQGDQASNDATALQLTGYEPGPPPLVLDLVEHVFAVRPIPVQLGQGDEGKCIVAHPHDILVIRTALQMLHKIEFRLRGGGQRLAGRVAQGGAGRYSAGIGSSPSASDLCVSCFATDVTVSLIVSSSVF